MSAKDPLPCPVYLCPFFAGGYCCQSAAMALTGQQPQPPTDANDPHACPAFYFSPEVRP